MDYIDGRDFRILVSVQKAKNICDVDYRQHGTRFEFGRIHTWGYFDAA